MASGPRPFDPRVFDAAVFDTSPLFITDTDTLHKPVDCVLAGQQPYKDRYREQEIHPPNQKTKTAITRSGVKMLRGAKPSYTTKTSKRGYD
jgi:hypothetical protein